jgi:hypothetical protein
MPIRFALYSSHKLLRHQKLLLIDRVKTIVNCHLIFLENIIAGSTIAFVWEDRRLRDITEADIRRIVDAGIEEHLQLEYKSELYTTNDNGNREFLLDLCMFANANGGILLIGIPERRDAEGQPTGSPDPSGEIGIETPNPDALLLGYDERAIATIQERIRLELFPIPVANGRYVIALRVANSTATPHCVRFKGHVYFPSRRERHRYEMDVREIKEMVMRTASRLEKAGSQLASSFVNMPRQTDLPYLLIGIIPVFGSDFLVDVQEEEMIRSLTSFDVGNLAHEQPTFNFGGLERRVSRTDISTIQVRRNGLILLNKELDVIQPDRTHLLRVTGIDITLRRFMSGAANVYSVAGLSGPFLVSMVVRTQNSLRSAFPGMYPGMEEEGARISPKDYEFPMMQADTLFDIDRIMRPLCDQAHQMFGRSSSSHFDANGVWSDRAIVGR